MKQMGRDSIAIVPTAPVRMRNNDVEYAYRPDSDFFYLTGFNEPESVAVLVPGPPAGRIHPVRARSRSGARDLGRPPRRARRAPRATSAPTTPSPSRDIDEILPGLLENRGKVFYAMGTHPEFDQRVRRLGERPAHAGAQRPPSAAGDRRARSRAARHAPVQEPRRSRHSCARRRASRRRRTCAP